MLVDMFIAYILVITCMCFCSKMTNGQRSVMKREVVVDPGGMDIQIRLLTEVIRIHVY